MTDAEFDAMMQHNPHLRITQESGGKDSVAAQIAKAHAAITTQLADNAQPYEPEMQAEVIAWADNQDHPALRWLFHPANGEYRTMATAARLKKMGVRPGVPDLWLPWWDGLYCGVVIEMKRQPNKPSAEQLEWLEHLRQNRWRCEVCYSAQAAIDVLREYLDIE